MPKKYRINRDVKGVVGSQEKGASGRGCARGLDLLASAGKTRRVEENVAGLAEPVRKGLAAGLAAGFGSLPSVYAHHAPKSAPKKSALDAAVSGLNATARRTMRRRRISPTSVTDGNE